MSSITTPNQAIFFVLGAAGLFFYCLHGAIQGNLYFPSKHYDIIMNGVAAWTLVFGSGSWLVSALIMFGWLRGLNAAWMLKIGISLIWVGVVCLVISRFLPGVTSTPI
jgi:hypothetical protein